MTWTPIYLWCSRLSTPITHDLLLFITCMKNNIRSCPDPRVVPILKTHSRQLPTDICQYKWLYMCNQFLFITSSLVLITLVWNHNPLRNSMPINQPINCQSWSLWISGQFKKKSNHSILFYVNPHRPKITNSARYWFASYLEGPLY